MFPCLFCLIPAQSLGTFGLESVERTLAFQNGLSTCQWFCVWFSSVVTERALKLDACGVRGEVQVIPWQAKNAWYVSVRSRRKWWLPPKRLPQTKSQPVIMPAPITARGRARQAVRCINRSGLRMCFALCTCCYECTVSVRLSA
jgi:hypothetical protein